MNDTMFSDFHQALLHTSAPLPSGLAALPQASERFAVHQQTCRSGLVEALRSTYPAIAAAVGTDYFDALAAEFILHAPPRSPVLQEYSPLFPGFLEHFPPLCAWPWLGDVARIDWARRESYHAGDADPMTAEQLQAWPVEVLMDASLRLSPSLCTLVSPHPAWSLWCCQMESQAAPIGEAWRAECTQVWRVDGEVRQRVIGAGEALLRQRLADRQRLGEALQAALAHDPGFNARTALTALISDDLIVAVIH
jgi:hypothetical protein